MWDDECQDSYDIGRNKDKVYSQKEKINNKYKIPNCFPAGWEWAGGWLEAICSLNLVALLLSQREDQVMTLYILMFSG